MYIGKNVLYSFDLDTRETAGQKPGPSLPKCYVWARTQVKSIGLRLIKKNLKPKI